MEKTRGDVVFKTILRQMRKSLSDDFNKYTHYMKLKMTQKKPEFLIDMLEKYFSKLNFNNKLQETKKDFVFFLGAFLYPKHMKKLVEDQQKQKSIDEIH